MKKILLIVSAAVLVVLIASVVVLTLSLGSIVKKGVETVGPPITKTEMRLDGASISVLSGSGTLKGFMMGNPEGYKAPSAFKVGTISVGVEPRSVLGDKVHVTHVRMQDAEITFEGNVGSQNNLSKILENVQAATAGDKAVDKGKSTPAEKGAGKKLQVDDILISNTKVNVSLNTPLGAKALTVALPEIHLSNLGGGPEGITAAELTKLVLSQVNAATLEAVQKAAAELGKNATEAVQGATKTATEAVDKAKSIGNLFQKKK